MTSYTARSLGATSAIASLMARAPWDPPMTSTTFLFEAMLKNSRALFGSWPHKSSLTGRPTTAVFSIGNPSTALLKAVPMRLAKMAAIILATPGVLSDSWMTREGIRYSQHENMTGKLPYPPLENSASGIFQNKTHKACRSANGNLNASRMFAWLMYLRSLLERTYRHEIPSRLNTSSEIASNLGPT